MRTPSSSKNICDTKALPCFSANQVHRQRTTDIVASRMVNSAGIWVKPLPSTTASITPAKKAAATTSINKLKSKIFT